MPPPSAGAICFAGNPLNRSANRKPPAFCARALHSAGARFCVIVQNKLICTSGQPATICWFDLSTIRIRFKALQDCTVKDTNESLDEKGLVMLLGEEDNCWHFAADCSEVLTGEPNSYLNASEELLSGREIVAKSGVGTTPVMGTCAIAGQALALAKWHSANRLCSFTGRRTIPIEAGAKRTTIKVDPNNKKERCARHYPRTDPVSIMLVVSPCGTKALLGRGHKYR